MGNSYSFRWADCYCKLEAGVLRVGNGAFERRYGEGAGMTDKSTGAVYSSPVTIKVTDAAARADNGAGLTAEHMAVSVRFEDGHTQELTLLPGFPFYTCAKNSPDEAFRLPDCHAKLTEVCFHDQTDRFDTLVSEKITPVFRKWDGTGNIFFAEGTLTGECLMLVKESPTIYNPVGRDVDHDAELRALVLSLTGNTYGTTVGIGTKTGLREQYKEYYTAMSTAGGALFTLSNTWGDRNNDRALCEEFVLREIDAAAALGTEIIQLDDGWQKGITKNSLITRGGVWEGYYATDPDFWAVNPTKFPHGLKPLCEKAAEKGIRLGLWFSPDSSDDFSNRRRDVETIARLYRETGARYFKLDGVNIRNEACRAAFEAFLHEIHTIAPGELSFQLDITAQSRFGYFPEKETGTLFVENRYTDTGSYYPHNTLKNIWQLAGYLPPHRFEFEVLNPRRRTDVYGDDPLAPDRYSMRWLFASVMLSNPLLWMEQQHLCEKDSRELAEMIALWRPYRKELFDAHITPFGKCPDGVVFSGLRAANGNGGHLLFFRGLTEETTAVFPELELPAGAVCTVLAGEGGAGFDAASKTVTMPEKRSFLWVRYEAE